MSNKNNRTKQLAKRFEELEEDILRLDEENSNLRQLIDVQTDCFKEREQHLQWEIDALKEQYKGPDHFIPSKTTIRKSTYMDKQLTKIAERIIRGNKRTQK